MPTRFPFHWAVAGLLVFSTFGCGGGEPAIDDEAAPVIPIESETTVDVSPEPELPPPPSLDPAPPVTPPAIETPTPDTGGTPVPLPEPGGA